MTRTPKTVAQRKPRKRPPDLRRDFAAALCMGAILQRMPYHESFTAWEQQLLGAAKRAKLAANVLLTELDREES